jgi:hypothetical protein
MPPDKTDSTLDNLFSATPSVEKEIVDELFSEENLDRKTELKRPIQWSVMKVLREFLDEHDLPYSSNILMEFVETSFRFLISRNRKGREEYVKALRAVTTRSETTRESTIETQMR